MKNELLGITWASADNIIFLPVLLSIFAVIGYHYYKKSLLVTALSAPQWRSLMIPNYSSTKQIIKIGFLMLGFSTLFLAYLQPQWDKKDEPIIQEGRDLFIALDISRSMLAQDMVPNRLECAKEKIKKLLTMLASDRVGLLLFAGCPVVQCPLTSDFAAFNLFLDQIDHNTISSGTTALDKAIEKTIDIFKTMPPKKNKLLVIFTDGEDFSSNLATIKDKAQSLGLRIITVGVGTAQGAPIPVLDDQGNKIEYQKDEKGAVVISALNEGILKNLASHLEGLYVSAKNDTTDLKKIVAYVERMEKERYEDKKIGSLEERYHYFIGISLLCFIVEWLL